MGDKAEVVYAFIDSQNLNLSVRNEGWKLDFRRFFVFLKDKFKVDKEFLFIGCVFGNEWLYSLLKNTGYVVIYKPTLDFMDGKERVIKGNVDAELVLHAMIQFPNYDKAIIVSGDGDYHCLAEYLESQKKLLHIVIPNRRNYSSLLRRFSKYFVFATDFRAKLEKRS